jgi:hypothetical protein
MARRLEVAEGFVYATVLPEEVGEDGTSPKFIVRSGEEKLTQSVLANLKTWEIKKDSNQFQIIFKFDVKRMKVFPGPKRPTLVSFLKRALFMPRVSAYECTPEPIKPSVKMWISPAGSIMVNVESKVDCLYAF